jgi:SAM-dependent methyltransferase
MAARKGGDFSGLSQEYQRYRPDYPGEITAAGAMFLRAGGLACDSRLLAVDVGAGTGISSRAWRRALGNACRIVGIEPGEDMRREAIAGTSAGQRIEYRIGTAEALPIATGEAGLVAAAQAAHWFDRPRFYAEANRVLGPAGWLPLWGTTGIGRRPPSSIITKAYSRRTPPATAATIAPSTMRMSSAACPGSRPASRIDMPGRDACHPTRS